MHKWTDVAFLIVVVALALVAFRPGSKAADVVSALGGAFAGAIQAATTGNAPRSNVRTGGRRH